MKSYRLFNKVFTRRMKKKIKVYLDFPFNEDIEVRVYGEVRGNGLNLYIVEGISNRGELWSDTYGETTFMVFDIDRDELRNILFTSYPAAYDYCIDLQARNFTYHTNKKPFKK